MSARSSCVLAGVFLVGAVVGAILGWMGRARVDETRGGGRPEPVESTGVDGVAGRGAGRGPAGAATPSGAPSAASSSGDASALLAAGAGAGARRSGDEVLATGTATLLVTMVGAPPEVGESATVYVLPAGGPGVDDAWDVPYGKLGESIVIPAPATYDVGVSFGEEDRSVSRVLDVRVEIGDSRTVDTSATGTVRRPIHMRLAPASLVHVPPGARLSVTWSRRGLRGRGFPGRGESQEGRPDVTTRFDPRTETDTPPLADDGPWHATAGLEEVPVGTGGPLEITVVPRLARAGDTVEIRIEPAALVRARASPPDGGWPDGTGPIRISWEGPGRPTSYEVRDLDELPRGVGLLVAPGRGRLLWSGPGVLPGASEAVEAAPEPGTATTVELRMTLDPGTVRPPGWLRVRIRDDRPPQEGGRSPGLARDAHGRTWLDRDASWIAWPLAAGGSLNFPPAHLGTFTVDGAFGVDPAALQAELRFVVGAGARVSDPVAVPGPGDLEVELRPGGWLVVLPGAEPARGRSAEASTLERLDGGVIPFSADAFPGHPTGASVRVPVLAGRVLGPFPEGPLRLRLRRGGIAVAELTVTVRAGAFEPLRLPR